MHRLLEGFRSFRNEDFDRHRDLFTSLGREQKPHTLFIGCSDSRVVPNLITRTQPGELFMIRNIANLVPYYRESEEFLSTTSAIEYAVQVLEVSAILVCGHSNCGGCGALFLEEERLRRIPHTRKWLQLAAPVRDLVRSDAELMADPARREWAAEQLNVAEQLRHLRTYPYIREREEAGALSLLGWYYVIERGEIFSYDEASGTFARIE